MTTTTGILTDASEHGVCNTQQTPTANPKQFNFARHWKRRIVPHLNDSEVVDAFALGLKRYDTSRPQCVSTP